MAAYLNNTENIFLLEFFELWNPLMKMDSSKEFTFYPHSYVSTRETKPEAPYDVSINDHETIF